MLLQGKVAVIYGAGGAVARAFAGEAARVYLTGRAQAHPPWPNSPGFTPSHRA